MNSIDISDLNRALRLAEELEELLEATHTLDYVREQLENLVENIKDNIQEGLSELGRHDCEDYLECCCEWECECSCHEEAAYTCAVSRDYEQFHEKVEENYPWQQKHLEKMLGHPTPCETRGCDGTLWVEYIENNRYLVKCTNDCRIIWVKAWSMPEAIQNALTYTLEEDK